jgi:SAM-dependent methyltransferase
VKKLLRRFIPANLKVQMALKRLYYLPQDTFQHLLGLSDPLIPPKGIIFTGSGDYTEIGNQFLRHFIELGNLQSNHSVLDVGCGIGRMAVPLTSYLSEHGSYQGFDIVPSGINWCKKAITSRHPNFNFQLADIRNDTYNPGGQHEAPDYRFPYPDNHFDFTLLTSIFTHMLPPDLENYLSEIARTLKPGGRCIITYCLVSTDSLPRIQAGETQPAFTHDLGDYWTSDPDHPEAAIAYQESYIRSQYEKSGLKILDPIHYGSWSGRDDFLDYQDIAVAVRE